MSTVDWALFISVFSLVIALASFIWNVWVTFIYPKPKIRVSFSIMRSYHEHAGRGPPAIALQATNFGPNYCKLHCAIASKLGLWPISQPEIGILNPYDNYPPLNETDSSGPFSGGLPFDLHVGETFIAYFPVSNNWFDTQKLERFGFLDTFGRYHWAPKRDIRRVVDQIKNDLEGDMIRF